MIFQNIFNDVWPKNMAPVTMATVMKNKHLDINYLFLRQNKQSKKVSPKSVIIREQPSFMVTENWYFITLWTIATGSITGTVT